MCFRLQLLISLLTKGLLEESLGYLNQLYGQTPRQVLNLSSPVFFHFNKLTTVIIPIFIQLYLSNLVVVTAYRYLRQLSLKSWTLCFRI